MSGPGLIDVHAHYLPDRYRELLAATGHERPDGFPVLPRWSATDHVALLDRLGIAMAVLSVSSPGVGPGVGAGVDPADLAVEVNDEGHRAVVDHPGRFALFASLPVPDVDATLAEISRCCDRLDVAGFVVLTNTSGVYPADPVLDPVWAELDRRRARVFLHPTSPPCWEATSLGRPRPMLEFLFETTRAVADLVLSGTVARHPGVELLIPHAGAALPVVADRLATFAPLLGCGPEVDVRRDLGRLHVDLAGNPSAAQLAALVELVAPDHLHYGTDHPFTPEPAVVGALERLVAAGDPAGSLLGALRANTERLLPRLAPTPGTSPSPGADAG